MLNPSFCPYTQTQPEKESEEPGGYTKVKLETEKKKRAVDIRVCANQNNRMTSLYYTSIKYISLKEGELM